MSDFFYAVRAEWLKLKGSPIVRLSFIAFGLAPFMAGLFIVFIQFPELAEKAGSFTAKARVMNIQSDWTSFLSILQQALAVGGILVFGFVISWIFGREFSDGTIKDLLALPIRRTVLVQAKFTIYILWCLGLAFSNLVIGSVIGALLQLKDLSGGIQHLTHHWITAFMVILSSAPVAFIASYGKGYLAPLGYVALTLVLAQILAAAGFGQFFPWAIPGLYSDLSGVPNPLTGWSHVILWLTGAGGYFLTQIYWNKADHYS